MNTTETTISIPVIGQHWPEQGGIYLGQRLINGEAHHIIVSPGIENDIESVEFSEVETAVVNAGEINGRNDWRAPDQEDLMLAYINAPEQFVRKGMGSIYWSRSEHHNWPWAVDFEGGFVYDGNRRTEFRVRPFRSIVASSI